MTLFAAQGSTSLRWTLKFQPMERASLTPDVRGPNVQAEFAREIRRFVACGTGLVDFVLVGR